MFKSESLSLQTTVAFRPGKKNSDVIISGERMAGKIEISVNRRHFWLERRWLSQGEIRVKQEVYHASGPAVSVCVCPRWDPLRMLE